MLPSAPPALRVALVGIGDAGRHHARALLAAEATGALRWSAFVARDPTRLARFRADLGVPEAVSVFPTYEALLGARVCDAVILATPDGVHTAQMEQAAALGLHALVEKPLALTVADTERALAAARRANVHLAVGYHLRHHAAHRLAKEQMPHLVGTLRSIHVRWAWPDPATEGWRARGVGARSWSLAALGTHGIDLALLFGGARPSRVAFVREPPAGADRAAEVSFALEGGALAHVSVSVAHRALSRLVVTGDLGEIEAVGTLGARGEGEVFAHTPRVRGAVLPFSPHDPYEAQLRAFAARARAGFEEDPAIRANAVVLDGILDAPL